MSVESRIAKLENRNEGRCELCGTVPGGKLVGSPELVEVGDPASPEEKALVEAISIKPCPQCQAIPHISVIEVIRPRA